MEELVPALRLRDKAVIGGLYPPETQSLRRLINERRDSSNRNAHAKLRGPASFPIESDIYLLAFAPPGQLHPVLHDLQYKQETLFS